MNYHCSNLPQSSRKKDVTANEVSDNSCVNGGGSQLSGCWNDLDKETTERKSAYHEGSSGGWIESASDRIKSWKSVKSVKYDWKSKVWSAWNNFRYSGKWMANKRDGYCKQGHKKIILLGRHYISDGTNGTMGSGFNDFFRDYYSRIWITYRTNMPPFSGTEITSDCGWGCMIRTTQMMLAHAIIISRLKRDWRYDVTHDSLIADQICDGEYIDSENFEDDPLFEAQREILQLFEDCPSAPLGIHRLLEIAGRNLEGSQIGRWYRPSEVVSVIKQALRESVSALTSDLSLFLSVDGRLVIGDAERESRGWTKKLLIFITLRLGANHINRVYFDHIRQLLSMENCLGIAGGKPDHSLYFIGYYGHEVIYLDPHVVHDYVPFSRSNLNSEDLIRYIGSSGEDSTINKRKKSKLHPFSSYHCKLLSKMDMGGMDPSCAVGFIVQSREELDETVRILNLNQVIDVDLGPGEGSKRTNDPLFTVTYQEDGDCETERETTEEEREQARLHGFELL